MERYRKQAEAYRDMADKANNDADRAQMLELAKQWEALARELATSLQGG